MLDSTMTDVAVNARDWSRPGGLLTGSGETVARHRALAKAAVCPRSGPAAAHYGSGTSEACQPESIWQQRTSKKFNHTTRIAMADGGALGSHPARDPV
jgi:hypothetical protein